MRGFVLGAIALVAGCAGDGAIVEVDTNGLDVATVELVISNRVCKDPDQGGECRSIQGKGFDAARGGRGDLFQRDGSAISDDIDRGKVAFELPDGELIPMAFAIGRDANDTIVGAAVMAATLDPGAGPIRYRVTLDPTDDLRFHSKLPGIAGAAQWGDANQCVGIEPVRSTLEVQRPLFILPEDDPDCDGRRKDEECDPLWFDGISFDESIAAHCVQNKNQVDGEPCLLGHVPTCIENPMSPNNPGCIQAAICLPSVVCDSCSPLDETCQQGELLKRPGEVRIDCHPSGDDVSATSITSACTNGGTASEFVIQPLNAALANATCTNVQLVETPSAAFHSTRGDTFAAGNATFEITQFDADCTVRLKWSGSFVTNESTHTVLTFTIDVVGQTREVWVPINFLIGGRACDGTVPVCTYIDSNEIDSLLKCALPMP